jgi:hypothetical protein
MLFMFPLFVAEMIRAATSPRGAVARLRAAGRGVALAAWHAADSTTRWSSATATFACASESIERYRLFDAHYLARNAVAAFALLPEIRATPP